MTEEKGESRAGVLEAAVVVPNVILLGIVAVYLIMSGGPKVEPLVKTDRQTAARIERLEQQVQRNPAAGEAALTLSELYNKTGEQPWSVDVLRGAERSPDRTPSYRMKLGMAYVNIGKNIDGLRVLKEALQRCEKADCPADIKAKLEIFTRVAELLVERRINARTDQRAAAKVFKEVLKPVRLNPASKMLSAGKAPKPATPPTKTAKTASSPATAPK